MDFSHWLADKLSSVCLLRPRVSLSLSLSLSLSPSLSLSLSLSVCVCVCVCVCVSAIIYPEQHVRSSPIFLRLLPIAVSRSSSVTYFRFRG